MVLVVVASIHKLSRFSEIFILFHYYPAFLVCICIAAAAVITPSRDLYICPTETVMFSCVINREHSDILRWTINFMLPSIRPIVITLTRDSGQSGINQIRTNNIGQSATFRLISTSPYMNSSMSMMIKESPEFSEVFVQCEDPSATTSKLAMSDSVIHIVTQGS